MLLILAAPEVPVGAYARTAINRMSTSGQFGDNFETKSLANLVSNEPNVRALIGKIALGEADAAIAYATDVTPDIAASVRTIAIPDEFNVVATYPIAAVSDSPNPEAAVAFLDFVTGTVGRGIMSKHGFRPVP